MKRQGVESLLAQRFEEAAAQFRAAANADPGDLEAVFLQGATANRLGQFGTAEPLLRQAERGGYRSAELDFELGWAAMGTGRTQTCIERLNRFEATSPGRGQASEFLGRCYLDQRQYEKSEAMFKRALELDPRLAPTVNLSMAALEQARGRIDAARERLRAAEAADAPTGRALRDLAGPAESALQPEKPLRLSASFTVGHNDNVIALGNTIPLPTDISRKGADFARLALGGSYTYMLAPATSATAGYALLLDRYGGLSSSNLNDHFVYADLFHQWSQRMALSFRLSGEFTEIAGSKFRDAFSFRPAISYQFNGHSVTEFAYSQAHNDYKAVVAPQFNRDGTSRSVSITHSMRLPGTRWGLALGASANRNDAEGNDFPSDGFGASAVLRYTFSNRVVAGVGVTASRDDYRNPNSLAGAGFAFARKDRQTALSAQLAGPLTDRLRWYVHAQSLRNNSNIVFYEYKQNVVSAGFAFDF